MSYFFTLQNHIYYPSNREYLIISKNPNNAKLILTFNFIGKCLLKLNKNTLYVNFNKYKYKKREYTVIPITNRGVT